MLVLHRASGSQKLFRVGGLKIRSSMACSRLCVQTLIKPNAASDCRTSSTHQHGTNFVILSILSVHGHIGSFEAISLHALRGVSGNQLFSIRPQEYTYRCPAAILGTIRSSPSPYSHHTSLPVVVATCLRDLPLARPLRDSARLTRSSDHP
jgi:hypothetical protein